MSAAKDLDTRRGERHTTRSSGAGVAAALQGVSLIVWNMLATPFIREKRLRWGTVGTEASDPLPGDEPEPLMQHRWPIEKIRELHDEPRISDARTRLALYLVESHLETGR